MSLTLTYPTFTRRRYPVALHDEQPAIDAVPIVVRRIGTYVGIPAFSIESTWRGASEIIAKYNYSLSESITVSRIEAQAGFCACISWKPTSNTIVRYKLWQDVGEILYVPLYNGEKIGSNFAIEIWNVQPEVGTGGGGGEEEVIVSENDEIITTEEGDEIVDESSVDDGEEIITTEEGDVVVDESGTTPVETEESFVGGDSLIGTITTITYGGSAVILTSVMLYPTAPFCDLGSINIGGNPTQCFDLTFDLTDFNPIDGDYYIVVGNCGDTTLVNGASLAASSFKLYCADTDTWHEVTTQFVLGEYRLALNQDDTTPGDEPYIVMRHILTDNPVTVRCRFIFDEYHFELDEITDGSETIEYNSLRMDVAGDVIATRVTSGVDSPQFITSQTPL